MGKSGSCKCCGTEGDFWEGVCDECFAEIEREKRDDEAERQYREDHT